LNAISIVYAGKRANAWPLDGPLTNRYNRITLAVGTMVLNGVGATPGTGAIVGLATIRQGEDLTCWELRDTDIFRALPRSWLQIIQDSRDFYSGNLETEVYSQVVILAYYTSQAAFAQAARRDLTFAHVYNEPGRYRGKPIHIEGRLLRIKRFAPTNEALEAGVGHLYEAWIHPEEFGAVPYVAMLTAWPSGLSEDLLSREKIEQYIRVSVDGYFFKKWAYRNRDGKEVEAPFMIGHSLVLLKTRDPLDTEGSAWVRQMVYAFVAMIVGLLGLVIFLTYWFRKNDNNIRRRILARMPEFALPPPDVPPVAAPVAQPVKTGTGINHPATQASRIVLSSGARERGGAASGDESGSSSGKKDKPPDEGAGA